MVPVGAAAALRRSYFPLHRRGCGTLPFLAGARYGLALALPSVLTSGLDSLAGSLARHLVNAFEHSDALAGDGLDLGAKFGRVVGDRLCPVARPADQLGLPVDGGTVAGRWCRDVQAVLDAGDALREGGEFGANPGEFGANPGEFAADIALHVLHAEPYHSEAGDEDAEQGRGIRQDFASGT